MVFLVRNERDLTRKMQLVDSLKFLYVVYVTVVVFSCGETFIYVILGSFGDTRKRMLKVFFKYRLRYDNVYLTILPVVLNSLSHDCDGRVDCFSLHLCRLIFEQVPLGGEVENRKVIRSS